MGSWICCQLGAREHYSLARALHTEGVLELLVTDAWVRPGSRFGALNRNLRERYHPDLADAPVESWNAGLLAFELGARAKRLSGWPLILERNRWYQRHALRALQTLKSEKQKAEIVTAGRSGEGHAVDRVSNIQHPVSSFQPTLFAYSYAALELFRFAKAQSWKVIMGQIDGGVEDERIVEQAHRLHRELHPRWAPAPAEYWSQWREECALADKIVVNSDWSKGLLEAAGVEPCKLQVIPVAFKATESSQSFQRSYPSEFNNNRPLRVLFLGAFAIRKGAAAVLEAIELMSGEPIEFSIVGSVGVEVPARFRAMPHVRWVGSVSRESTAKYYRECDVFLFPTVSDGFGMTQVEARAWKMPIIATPFCAPIVQHGVNGLVISELTGSHLATAIRELLRDPKLLKSLADGDPGEYQSYHPDRVREQLLALGD